MELGLHPSTVTICNVLRETFPDGDWFSDFHLKVGPRNAIRIHQIDLLGISLNSPSRCLWEDDEGVLDSCDIETHDDLIGWASYVRTEIETGAVNYILTWCGPETAKALTDDLNAAWGALWACGVANMAIRLKKEANFAWLGNRESVKGNVTLSVQLNNLFYRPPMASISGEGHVSPLDSLLKYSYYIPVDYPLSGKSALTNTGVIRIPGLDMAKAQEALTGVYLDALCNYVIESSRKIQSGG